MSTLNRICRPVPTGLYKFRAWAKLNIFDGDLLIENDFKKQLKKEPYCKDYNKSARLGGNVRKCVELNIEEMKTKGLELNPCWGSI